MRDEAKQSPLFIIEEVDDIFSGKDILALNTILTLSPADLTVYHDVQNIGELHYLANTMNELVQANLEPLSVDVKMLWQVLGHLDTLLGILASLVDIVSPNGGTNDESIDNEGAKRRFNVFFGEVLDSDENLSVWENQLDLLSKMSGESYRDVASAIIKTKESTDFFNTYTEVKEYADIIFGLTNRYGLDFVDTMDKLALALSDGTLNVSEMNDAFASSPAAIDWLQELLGDSYPKPGKNMSTEFFADKILNLPQDGALYGILEQMPTYYDESALDPFSALRMDGTSTTSLGIQNPFTLLTTQTDNAYTAAQVLLDGKDDARVELQDTFHHGVQRQTDTFSVFHRGMQGVYTQWYQEQSGQFTGFSHGLQNAFFQGNQQLSGSLESMLSMSSGMQTDMFAFLSGLFSAFNILNDIRDSVVAHIVNPFIELVNSGIALVNRLFKTDISPLQQVQGNEEAMAPMQWFAQYFADKAMQSESAYQEALLAAQTSGSVTAAPQVLFENLLQSGAMVDPVVLENTADGVFSLVDVGNIGNGLSSKHWDAEQRERQLYVSDEQVYRLQLLDAVNTASAEENQPVQLTVNATANIYKDSDADSFVESLIDQMMSALSGRSSR